MMQKYKSFATARMRIRLYYDYNRKISYQWGNGNECFDGRTFAEKIPVIPSKCKKTFIKRQKFYDKHREDY